MKRIIVQKYGGSSVSNIDKIKKVAKMICETKDKGYEVAVVVSAMGKTTEELLALAHSVSQNPPRRELDMLLSVGERISMALLSIAIHDLGYEAVSLTGSQSGIITNDRHSDARIIEVRPIRVQDELERGKIVIVAGFQGMSYKREITTLGRGGSDTTAVALAAALGAERCEIYSDVDGVYTADPNIVKGARHIPVISYPEMQEMANAGAKVLASDAVEFAKRAGIAIYCRSTFSPGRETIVRKDLVLDESRGVVRAVVYEKDIVRVRLRGEKAYNRFFDILRLSEREQLVLKELNLSVPLREEYNTNDIKNWSRANFVLSLKNIHSWGVIKEKLLSVSNGELEIDEHLSALSLIGEGINRDNKILIRALEIAKENNFEVAGITTTSFRISFLIPKKYIEEALVIYHKQFIEECN